MFGGNIQLSPLHITAENGRLDSRKIGISGLNLFNLSDFQRNPPSYTACLTSGFAQAIRRPVALLPCRVEQCENLKLCETV